MTTDLSALAERVREQLKLGDDIERRLRFDEANIEIGLGRTATVITDAKQAEVLFTDIKQRFADRINEINNIRGALTLMLGELDAALPVANPPEGAT